MTTAIDFENVQLILLKCNTQETSLKTVLSKKNTFYIGEVVYMQLICKISDELLHKVKTPQPVRSPVSLNIVANLKRQLAGALDIKCTVRGLCKNKLQQGKESDGLVQCKVISTNGTAKGRTKRLNTEAFLSEDKQFYHVPIEARILDIPSQCKNAEICVNVRPSSKFGPTWLSSPTKPESPSVEDQDLSTQTTGKIVLQNVRVIHPPQLSVKHSHSGNREIILIQVKNSSSFPMNVLECKILPEACPKTGAGSHVCTSRSDLKNICIVHASMVKVMSSDASLLPALLRPGECMSLCYKLDLTQFEASFPKDDVVLEGHVKWNIPVKIEKDSKEARTITTIYRLYSLRVRKGLFVMSAQCDDVIVKKGQSFTVTYTIHNRLQDFLSIKLHWCPVLTDDSIETVRNFEKIKTSLICCDPSVQLGPCHYGDTVEAKVSFYAMSKGLFEVCKHMKINLRYLIPGSDNNSLASPVSQGSTVSDDHLGVVPDQLSRTRSGSGSSFGIPRPLLETRSISTANKSYSSGDIGPDNTSDTDLFKKPKSNKSPVLPRRDPKLNVCPSKYEQMLLSPGNFIKNSCVILVE